MSSIAASLFPLVSADVALFSVDQGVLHVLLVKRAAEPAVGQWALPGAVLKPDLDSDLEATARRALRDKISVEIAALNQVAVFSGAARDPRGWSVAVLFAALLPRDQVQAVVRNKVEEAAWKAVDSIENLAFDHHAQLLRARDELRDAVERHELPLHLLPAQFTLTELQRTCEAVLGRELDKSVFRRRLKTSTDIVEVPDAFVLGAQRPAQLYQSSKSC